MFSQIAEGFKFNVYVSLMSFYENLFTDFKVVVNFFTINTPGTGFSMPQMIILLPSKQYFKNFSVFEQIVTP